MKFSLHVQTRITDWQIIRELEDLGYDAAWVPDTQMMWSDCYATMALALVSGASYVEATALGNLAAGIVVRKSGTATTSQREMLETLEQLNIPE